MNRKDEAGFSINKIVSADDEWAAEAYMETNYDDLSKLDFIRTVKDYIFFNELYLKNHETDSNS